MTGVLLSEQAWAGYGGQLQAAVPGLSWSTFDRDSQITPRYGESQDPPSIAWLTHDVFLSGLRDAFFAACHRLPELSYVQTATASADSDAFRALMGAGVRVASSHVTGLSIAEFVFGSVLEIFQGRQARAEQRRQRLWAQTDFREVAGSTWLIIGFGAVGGTLASRVRAFDGRVIGVRQTIRGDEAADLMLTLGDIEPHIPGADVVVLCAPPSAATRGLVDADFLARMKPDSVLVNVARGALVDDHALLEALSRGTPAHAVLDVFTEEPLPSDSPWWDHPAVTVSPHTSGCGSGRYQRAADMFAANLRRYLAAEPLRYEIALDA